MWALLVSSHLRAVFVLTLVAYLLLLLVGGLWCCARMCCIVPRRAREYIGALWYAVLFAAAALTAYTLAEAHSIEKTQELFFV